MQGSRAKGRRGGGTDEGIEADDGGNTAEREKGLSNMKGEKEKAVATSTLSKERSRWRARDRRNSTLVPLAAIEQLGNNLHTIDQKSTGDVEELGARRFFTP